MTAKEKPVSQPANEKFREAFDRIFGHKCKTCGEHIKPKDIHECKGKK